MYKRLLYVYKCVYTCNMYVYKRMHTHIDTHFYTTYICLYTYIPVYKIASTRVYTAIGVYLCVFQAPTSLPARSRCVGLPFGPVPRQGGGASVLTAPGRGGAGLLGCPPVVYGVRAASLCSCLTCFACIHDCLGFIFRGLCPFEGLSGSGTP